MTGWYYIKSGMIEDETVGPISGDELLRLARGGDLSPKVMVLHEKTTKNQWVEAGRLAPFQTQWESGENERREAVAAKKAEKQRKKEEARQKRKDRKLAEEAKRREVAAERARIVQARVAGASRPPLPSRGGAAEVVVECPYCHSTGQAIMQSKTSTAGIIFFVVLFLFLCWPLCWIGLLMKETYHVCGQCGLKISA